MNIWKSQPNLKKKSKSHLPWKEEHDEKAIVYVLIITYFFGPLIALLAYHILN